MVDTADLTLSIKMLFNNDWEDFKLHFTKLTEHTSNDKTFYRLS